MGVGIFYALGGALTLEGVLSGIYMIFMLIFILKLYLDEKNFKTVFRFIYNKLTNCCSLEKGSIGVLDILPCMFVILINILMATFFAISQRPGVSRYLLAILMINMMCYEVLLCQQKSTSQAACAQLEGKRGDQTHHLGVLGDVHGL